MINTQYMRNPDMVYVLKMEYVSKITIFSLKMMVKSGLEKILLKFLHVRDNFPLLHKSDQNHKFSNENIFLHGIFGYRFHFEGKPDV